MKHLAKFLFCILLLSSAIETNAQLIQTGVYSGINFSNPQGDVYYDRWITQKGPVNAVYLNVQLLKSLSFQTEIDFTTITYQKQFLNYYYIDNLLYNINATPTSTSSYSNYTFNFYRFPLMLKFTTQNKIKLQVGMGIYWSICDDHSISESYYPVYLVPDKYIGNFSDVYVPKTDYGYVYSLGFSTAVNTHVQLSLNARYFSGRRTFIDLDNCKNGVFELVMGIGYDGFVKRNALFHNKTNNTDSTKSKLSYKLIGGAGFSYNKGEQNSNYTSKQNLSGGIGFAFQVSNGFHLQTEMLFEQKGYGLKGTSVSDIIYTQNGQANKDNTINFNYFVVPVIASFSAGYKVKYFFNAGVYSAMLIDAKVTGTSTTTVSSDNSYGIAKTTINTDINGYFYNNDFGWLVGTGVRIPFIFNSNLEIECRYTEGFHNIYNPTDGDSSDKIQNQSINLLVGLQFPFKY